MKSIFSSGSSLYMRLLIVAVLSAILILIDKTTNWLDPAKRVIGLTTVPFYHLLDIPYETAEVVDDMLTSRADLIEMNKKLASENIILKKNMQRMAALTAENIRLRETLGGSKRVDVDHMLTEVVSVDPDPFVHRTVVDVGLNNGVQEGWPVIDAKGLIGQVVEVGYHYSRVLLITDSTHAVPVEVHRNGTRAIAVGTGDINELKLIYVADTADVVEGDLLLTSGLGGKFPPGYPVARVTSVYHDPGRPYALVKALPVAELDRSRQWLVLKTPKAEIEQDFIERNAQKEAGVAK
ncbi:rod shape-determining protein MreC [Litoribrevibacter albus]|uniref:Cell shape-determining protein MreC n=1 Tax=Litoribrevibacter albus TaxID=1473156 RepID=A0AA37SBD7_9GAMM|nr:rod shape-determining protein MreC [Litoribrevibacter albus]GLQ31311.1 cell shape-determining protein MreC [Litoribrevibacter albus]